MALFESLLLAAAVLAPAAGAGDPPVDGIKVHAVRFYDSGSGLTQVRAFIQIPLEAFSPTSDAMLSYQVRIQLRDSAGGVLSEDAWPQQHVPATMQAPGVTTVNSVEFVLRPGKYRLDVSVRDSVTGSLLQAGADLVGYAEAPPASDLVLSPGMRALAADSTQRGSEWRNGSLLVTSAAELILNPLRSKAFYLLEAYSGEPDSGSMRVRIRDSAGTVMVVSPTIAVRLGVGGGVLRGQLDMEGLPPGRYTLEVGVELGAQTIERAGSFVMAEAGETRQNTGN